MKAVFRITTVLALILLMGIAADAQYESYLFVCINFHATSTSAATDAEATTSRPVLIGYDNTSMLGFVLSEPATITVYTAPQARTAVGVYNVTTDAVSGSYRRDSRLGILYTNEQVPNQPDCLNEYPEYLTAELHRTQPFLVSPEQAFIIQTNDDNLLETSTILGVLGFHSVSDATMFSNFQLLQFSNEKFRLFLPYIERTERFVVIGNKSFLIARSFEEAPDTFASGRSADVRSTFLLELASETPPVDLQGLMRDAYFRLYPANGLIIEYTPRARLRIEMSDIPLVRAFAADNDKQVQALDGFRANYFAAIPRLNEQAFGRLEGPQTAPVVRVDERGQLVILTGTSEVIIEAWAVELIDG